jgi:predicted ribosome-associated RNA-binding protein Tma20
MSLHGTLETLFEQFDSGEVRYWVNDGAGIMVSGIVKYGHSGTSDAEFTNYIGLVDEEKGGMIAYGEPAIMEELADKLNRLHAIESITAKT